MKKGLKAIIAFSFIGVLILFIFYLAAAFIPLDLNSKKENITLYDIHGDILYESNFKKNLTWTDIEEIPVFLQDMVVSIEDKRFYSHIGFDPIRIVKAMSNNLLSMEIVEGGSTISQQMAKNMFLSNEQTFSRKLEELFYAAQMEMQYDKNQILEGYLNTLYYGHGIYGIASASQFFFGVPMEELSIAQAAMLIGIPNGPSLYSPLINEENAKARQTIMLDVLLHNELINQKEYTQALQEDLNYNTEYEVSEDNAYYIQAVLDELYAMDKKSPGIFSQGGYVNTYYDPQVQEKLSAAIRKHQDASELETSAIITQPFSGNILAIAGGKDYTLSQYNRALYSKRQVASTIKPLLYYSALESGFTPSTTFFSSPTTFQVDEKNTYAPTNYNNNYPNRDISLINAISMSDNIYAVKTHLFLGMDTLANSLNAFHIEAEANPSLALGTVEMSLMELSSIYNTFASTGLYYEPSLIDSITNYYGNTLYERNPQQIRLLGLDATLMLNQMLTGTFDLKNKTVSFPTMYGYAPKVEVGAKSGTSDFDSLVVGYNPDYTVAVWCGFDDSRYLDKEYYNVSKEVFLETFNSLYEEGSIGPWYQRSSTLVSKTVDPISGKESLLGSEYWYRNQK